MRKVSQRDPRDGPVTPCTAAQHPIGQLGEAEGGVGWGTEKQGREWRGTAVWDEERR